MIGPRYRNIPELRQMQRPVPVASEVYHQKSFSLDGASEYVSMGGVLGFERTNPFTLCCWFKSNGVGVTLMGKCESAGNFRGYALSLDQAAGYIRMAICNTYGTNWLVIRDAGDWNDNVWHHVAVSYAGNSLPAGVLINVDGLPRVMTTVANNLSATIINAVNFSVGARNGVYYVPGAMAEVGVFSTALDLGQMVAVYRGRDLRQLPFSSSLVGYWSGDGSSGSLMPDYSTSGYNGTPVNMDASNFTADVHTPT